MKKTSKDWLSDFFGLEEGDIIKAKNFTLESGDAHLIVKHEVFGDNYYLSGSSQTFDDYEDVYQMYQLIGRDYEIIGNAKDYQKYGISKIGDLLFNANRKNKYLAPIQWFMDLCNFSFEINDNETIGYVYEHKFKKTYPGIGLNSKMIAGLIDYLNEFYLVPDKYTQEVKK